MSYFLYNTPFLACCLLCFSFSMCLYFNIFSTPVLSVLCRGARCLWKVWWDLENLPSFPDKHYWNMKHRIFPQKKEKNPLPAFSFDPASLYKRLESRSYYISEIKSDLLGLRWYHNRTIYSGVKDFTGCLWFVLLCFWMMLNSAHHPQHPRLRSLSHFLQLCQSNLSWKWRRNSFWNWNAFLQTKTCPDISTRSLIKKSFRSVILNCTT